MKEAVFYVLTSMFLDKGQYGSILVSLPHEPSSCAAALKQDAPLTYSANCMTREQVEQLLLAWHCRLKYAGVAATTKDSEKLAEYSCFP
jgi:hypothetical protein